MTRAKKLLALLAALTLVLAACGGDSADDGDTGDDGTTTTTQAPVATTTTQAAGDDDGGDDGEMMGPAFDVGFDEETGTIKLGVLAALTGPIPAIGQSVLDGQRVYWEKVNAAGGIAGTYPVELVVRDNQYSAETTPVVYNEIKDEVLAFSSTLGTPSTAPLVAPSAAEGILIAAGSLASQWALTENIVLNLGANTYFAQFANGPYWAMEIADPAVMTTETVVGIVYPADDYGADCKAGYDFAQENLGFNAAYEATFASTDTEFSGQIGGAAANAVEVLFVCGLPSALATMLGTAAAIEYSPAIFGSSPSYNVVLPAALGQGDEAAGLALFNSFPYYNLGTSAPFESDEPGLAGMRADLAEYGQDVAPESVNAFFFFGYTQAATFNAILEAAIANGDITRAGLLAAVADVKDVDLGLGAGTAGYGTTVAERIPTNQDSIGVPVSVSEAVFGFRQVSDFFEAPFLADWDPAS